MPCRLTRSLILVQKVAVLALDLSSAVGVRAHLTGTDRLIMGYRATVDIHGIKVVLVLQPLCAANLRCADLIHSQHVGRVNQKLHTLSANDSHK